MRRLRVLLFPPSSWTDASPSQGYPQHVAGSHLFTWVERDKVGWTFLAKETARWKGLGIEPPTFRSEVHRANHYTTAPGQKFGRRSFVADMMTYLVAAKLNDCWHNKVVPSFFKDFFRLCGRKSHVTLFVYARENKGTERDTASPGFGICQVR